MSIQNCPYDENKIQSLKRHLELSANNHQPRFYEILVDNFKIVPKTNQLEQFCLYEDHIDRHTDILKIIIFPVEGELEKEHYVFHFKKSSNQNQDLNGIGDSITETVQKELEKERKYWELDLANNEISRLKKDLQEAEGYVNQLTTTLKEVKENGNKFGKIHIGEIVGVALESMARRNPQILAKIPGASGLAGLIEQDNIRAENPTPNTEASFTKKSQTPPTLSEDEQLFVGLMGQLKQFFSTEQFEKVIDILDALARKPEDLDTVLDLLDPE